MVKTVNKRSRGKKINDNAMISQQGLNILKWLILAALAVVIFYPPFLRGLYFEAEQLPAEIYTFVIFAAFWIYKVFKRDKRFLETPIDYAAFGFVLVYLLSILVSVGTRQAISEWLKYCMFFAIFFMLSDLLNSYRSRVAVLWVIMASALGVSILGIDGAAGAKIANSLNELFKSLGADNDVFFGLFVGNRINSTLQYPNALASYLMAVYFVCLALTVASAKPWVKIIGSASSYVLIITFMLTMSRGAYLFLPIAAALFIVFLPTGNKVRGVAYALPSVVGMGATVAKLSGYIATPEGNESNLWKYVLIGIGISAIICVLVTIAEWVIDRIKRTSPSAYKAIVRTGISLGIVMAALGIVGAVLMVTAKVPLELAHGVDQNESVISVRRSVALKPDKEYKLVFDVEAENSSEKPNAYMVTIASRNFAGTIEGSDTFVTSLQGIPTKGVENKEIKFMAPSDSRTVSFTFSNQYPGTRAVFNNAKVVPVNHEDKVEMLTLKYKFIPESIYSRFDEAKETRSGIERTIFYRDGLKIIKDHWLLGAGGGAWPLLYFSKQSYFYWTTQAHNYIVQIGVECGVVGLLVFVLLLFAIVFVLIREMRFRNKNTIRDSVLQAGLFAAIVAMFMHSAIDFDLSLSAVFLMLWQLIAVFNSMARNQGKEKQEEKNTEGTGLFLSKMDIQDKIKKIPMHPAIGVISILIVIIFPIMFQSAANYAKKASADINFNNLAGAIQNLKKAVDMDGFMPNYKVDYANLVIKQDQKAINQKDIITANKYAQQIEKQAENNVDIAVRLGAYYLGTANIEKGLHYIDRTTELRPLRPEEWQQRADAYVQVAMFYLQQGDRKNGEAYLDKAIAVAEEAKEANRKNMIPFVLNANGQEIFERVNFIRDHANSQIETDIGKIAFYSLHDMDINSDELPDQWTVSTPGDVTLHMADGKVIAESAAGKTGYIQTRSLNLLPSRTYRIEVELVTTQEVGTIPFVLTGISEKNEGLKLSEGVYTAEVTTPENVQMDGKVLMLGVSGKVELKGVRVVEK